MSNVLWMPIASSSSEYELAVCVGVRATLNVLIVGPPPTSGSDTSSQGVHMTVKVVDGNALTFRGLVSSGSKRQSLYVGEFELPVSPEQLLVTLERLETEIFSGIAAPLPNVDPQA